MENINVALLQMTPCQSQIENMAKGEIFCRKAKNAGCDIALFPEMWNCGYQIFHRSILLFFTVYIFK